MSMPIVALRTKLEIVAPVKVTFRNRAKSMNGLCCLRSKRTKAVTPTTATAASPSVVGSVQPSWRPKMSRIIRARTDTMKMASPGTSNLLCSCSSALLSGVPQMRRMARTEMTTEA